MQEIRTIEHAILVSLESGDSEFDRSSMDELRELADTAGAEVIGEFWQKRQKPDVATFIGKGKAEELFAEAKTLDADLVIVNDEMTPTQLRNLGEVVSVRLIDRTQLILDIFAQRAQTHEGKLQVELAQLQYLLPRITSVYTLRRRKDSYAV